MYLLKINFFPVSCFSDILSRFNFSVKDFLEKGEYENQENFWEREFLEN